MRSVAEYPSSNNLSWSRAAVFFRGKSFRRWRVASIAACCDLRPVLPWGFHGFRVWSIGLRAFGETGDDAEPGASDGAADDAKANCVDYVAAFRERYGEAGIEGVAGSGRVDNLDLSASFARGFPRHAPCQRN
jgi:hypothetical protein